MPVISGSTSKIIASIVSTFDAKGVKQAEKSLNSFGNLSKKFGKTLGVSLSAAAVIGFGKAAVDQFSKSEKAANELGMALVSVGKASEYVSTQHFLNGLQDTTGILKDSLIPAMNSLLIQTKDVTESQKLLGIATDISASGAADLQSTAVALGKAYNGNLTALAKLNVGISIGQAKTNSYAQAVKYLADFYKGDAAKAADTFAGKMKLVKAATNDAMAAIGSGIVEGIANLSGSTKSIDGIINGIKNIGFVVGQELAGLGIGLKKIFDGIASNPVFKAISGALGKGLSFLGKKTGITAAIQKDLALGKAKQLADEKAKQAQLLAIEKSRLATQRATLTAAKDAAAEAKKQLILKAAGDVLSGAQDLFNLDNIELAAAMLGKQTDSDMARLKIKKDILDLEKAINEQNVTAATQIAQTLISDAEQFAKLREASNNLSGIPDPFLGWLQTIQAMVAQMLLLAQVAKTVQLGTFNVGSEFRMGESAGNAAAGLPANSLTNFMGFGDEHLSQLARMADGGVVTQATPVIAGEAGAEAIIPLDKFGGFGGGNVTVNVAGSVITQQQLLDAISQGLQNQGASGRTTTFNRLNSPYIA
jgi:hypothetical protein